MKRIKYILLAVLLLQIVANAGDNKSEDELLMQAIYYSQKDPKESANSWKKLFELTNNEKYLVEYFYASLQYKDIKEVIKEIKEVLRTRKSKELYELLGGLYSKDGDTDGVIEVIENLSGGNIESMYELAYLYSLKGEDDKSLAMYKKIYAKEHSWKSLKGILSILVKEKKKKEAAELLWKEVHSKKLPKEAYLALGSLLNFEKETDKAIYVFKYLHKNYKNRDYTKQLISLYLFNKDYDSLIKLLEESHFDDNLLYELYISKLYKVKAYKLLYKLYKDTKKPKWLAERAILTYEIADQLKAVDDRVLNRMSELFEKAFKEGADDPMYYNYYGYTLIDYDKDINKGIEYVKKALAQKPNNSYYIDSLAWGYYKIGKCKEAKELMQKLKKLGPIEEDDILKHYKKIEKCKDK